MTFTQWITQYNKAFVPVIMIALYFINKKFGWDIPLSEDDVMLLFAAITALGVHQVPNTKV